MAALSRIAEGLCQLYQLKFQVGERDLGGEHSSPYPLQEISELIIPHSKDQCLKSDLYPSTHEEVALEGGTP